MDLVNLKSLTSPNIVVIDTVTGTVLSPEGLVVAYVPSGMMEQVSESDSEAVAWGKRHGYSLYSDADEW